MKKRTRIYMERMKLKRRSLFADQVFFYTAKKEMAVDSLMELVRQAPIMFYPGRPLFL
jgi:hypothetical protein